MVGESKVLAPECGEKQDHNMVPEEERAATQVSPETLDIFLKIHNL